MSLQQRPLTAYFGVPDSKFAKGRAAVPASNTKKTDVATKPKKENETPGSNASRIGTAKGSPSVKKVAKTRKSSAVKEAGVSPAASTTGPSPHDTPNKMAKSPSSTARKAPVAKKSKTAKKAPPAPKVKKAASSRSSSSKNPTTGVKTPPSGKKPAKSAELISTNAGKVSATNKMKTAKEGNSTSKLKHVVTNKSSSLVLSPAAGTEEVSPSTRRESQAVKVASTAVIDNTSIPESSSDTKTSSMISLSPSAYAEKPKAAASLKISSATKSTGSSTKTPPSMEQAIVTAESKSTNTSATHAFTLAAESPTKTTKPRQTKSKEQVAKKTNKAKKAPPPPKNRKGTCSKASCNTVTLSAGNSSSLQLANSNEHQQVIHSVAVTVANSTPTRNHLTTENSGSVDNVIESLALPESEPTSTDLTSALENAEDKSRHIGGLHPASGSREIACNRTPPRVVKSFKSPTIAEKAVEPLPRISAKLTFAMLKEEAVCRGYVLQSLPRTKADLLSLLSDGSIHLTGTRAWKEIEALKVKMLEEQRELANKRREKEIESQRVLHVHDYPRIHSHPLANTMTLVMNGKSRDARCEHCGISHPIQWTCENCDFDICRFCFHDKNMTREERLRERQERERKRMLLKEEREREQRIMMQLAKERETEEQSMIDRASEHFGMSIICPPDESLDSNGNTLKGYTVWCSVGSRWEGPPKKEFDSTWKTSHDANERARYLFFWKNVFDHDPDDMWADQESAINGLVFYSVQPDIDKCWSVGVVPDVAFLHLPNASSIRHNHDREHEESCFYSGGMAY